MHTNIGSLKKIILILDHEITTGQCQAYNAHSDEWGIGSYFKDMKED